MADTSNLTNFLTDVADAIKNKKGITDKIPAANFDTEIASIESGVDTSDATATVDDILFPKTAYTKDGKVVGNIAVEYITGDDIQAINLSTDLDKTSTNAMSKLLAVTEDGTGLLAPVMTDNIQCLGVFRIENDSITLLKSYSFESLGMTNTNRVRFSLGRKIEGLKYPLYYGNVDSTTLCCQIIDFSNKEPISENNRATVILSNKLMTLECHPVLADLVYVLWYVNNFVWTLGVYELDYATMTLTKKFNDFRFNIAGGSEDKGKPCFSNDGSVLTFAGSYVADQEAYDGYVLRLNNLGERLGITQVYDNAMYNGVSPDGKYCVFNGTLYSITENGTSRYFLNEKGNTGLASTFEFGYRFINDAKNVISIDENNVLTITELDLTTGSPVVTLWSNRIYGVASNQTNTDSLYVINSDRTAIIKFTYGTTQIPSKMVRDNRTYIDTSDATAEAREIVEGKTAYANDEKLTGTLREVYSIAEEGTDAYEAGDYKIYVNQWGEYDYGLDVMYKDSRSFWVHSNMFSIRPKHETLAAGIGLTAEKLVKGANVLGIVGTGETGAKANIFMQETEPEIKEGIWLQGNYQVDNMIADKNVFTSEEWNTTATLSTIPYNFNDGFAVVIGTDIYLLSGTGDGVANYKYDTLTDTYTRLANIPYDFNDGFAVAIGTDIYLFGGDGGRTTAYKYDTLTDTYTNLANIPYDFYDGSAVAIGTDIYLLGGTYSKTNNYKYDTLTDTYTNLAKIPYELKECSPVAIGTDIYLLGGYYYTTNNYKYDTLTNTYIKLTNIPYEFKYGASTVVGTNIYLFGSYVEAYYKYAYKYDALTDTYTRLADVPYNFFWGQAVFTNKNIYLLGGNSSRTKIQIMTMIPKEYPVNSIVISQSGSINQATNLCNAGVTGLKTYYDRVYYEDSEGNLLNTIPTYNGDGTSWTKIN